MRRGRRSACLGEGGAQTELRERGAVRYEHTKEESAAHVLSRTMERLDASGFTSFWLSCNVNQMEAENRRAGVGTHPVVALGHGRLHGCWRGRGPA